MPKEPPEFDCRSAGQVLRLRLRDWMWPTALAIVVAITVLNRTALPREPGLIALLLGGVGPWIWIAALVFAGGRWCWIGHFRPRGADRCGRCGYPTAGRDGSDSARRCPECGVEPDDRRTSVAESPLRASIRGAPIARWLIDVPGLLALLFALFMFTMSVLILLGVVDID